ncbi:MAG: glycerophosphodiester phosphodiesterase family protein [Planctomycetota bacterium]
MLPRLTRSMMHTLAILLSAICLLGSSPGSHRRIVIAQGGASHELPRNSLAAFVRAYHTGAQYIQADAVLSSDNVLFGATSPSLDTFTNIAELYPDRARDDGGWYSVDFTSEELARVRHRHDSKVFQPTLSSLDDLLGVVTRLNETTGRRIGVGIKLLEPVWHQEQGHDIVATFVETLDRLGYKRRAGEVLVQADDATTLLRVRRAFGQPMRLVLAVEGDEPISHGRIKGYAEWGWGILPDLSTIEADKAWDVRAEEWVQVAHDAGLYVFVSDLAGDEVSMDRAVRRTGGGYRADGIESTHPELAIEVVEVIHGEEDALKEESRQRSRQQ